MKAFKYLAGFAFLSLLLSSCSKDDTAPVVDPGVYISNHDVYGEILVDHKGITLYFFTRDFSGSSLCEDGCLDSWPVFYNEELIIGSGLNLDDFSLISRPDGKGQITYKGWPLYYYGNDMEIRGNTKGVSVPAPGVWPVVNGSTIVAEDPLRAAAEAYFNENLKSLITNTCVSCHLGKHSSGSSKYDVFDNAYANAETMYMRVAGLQGALMPQGGPQLS